MTLTAWAPAWLAASEQSDAADEYDVEMRAAMLRDAARLYPQDPDIRESLARAYALQAPPRPDLALVELEKAVALSPMKAVYYLDLAELLEATGRLDGSAAVAAKAVALEPNCLEGRLMLAAAAARRGDGAQARAAFAEVVRRAGEIENKIGGGFERRVCGFDRNRFETVRKMVESARE